MTLTIALFATPFVALLLAAYFIHGSRKVEIEQEAEAVASTNAIDARRGRPFTASDEARWLGIAAA